MRGWITGALGALALGCAGPAGATTIVATSTGTISSGFDQSGLFGASGSSLVGVAYTLTAAFDGSIAQFEALPGGSELFGGPDFGSISPADFELTVGAGGEGGSGLGVTDIAQNQAPVGTTSQSFMDALNGASESQNFQMTMFANGNGGISGDVFTPPPGNLCSTDVCGGSFSFVVVENGVTTVNSYGTFAPTSYTIAGVPEPATWALMFIGAFGVGATLRRWTRQRVIGSRPRCSC
jgi:hypothetical protein